MSKKISELDDAATLTGNELIELVQSGGNNKITLDALFSAPLWGDRTIDLNGHDFYIGQNGDNLFGIDLDGAGSWMYSHFTPDGQGLNEGAFSTLAVEGGVDFLVDASFNGAAKEARISGHAEATTATLDYLADSHTFHGGIIFPDSDPHIAGAWWDNSGTLTRSSG